ILPKDLDCDPWLFNVQNATINLKTGELRPHRKCDFITKLAPVWFDPEAACPRWYAALKTMFPKDDVLIKFLCRLCGISLTGTVHEQKLPILFGAGDNGKSTYCKTLLGVVGPDYGTIAPPGLLMTKQHEAHPTDRASLFGMRLVIEMETEEG